MTIMGVLVSVFGVLFFIVLVWAAIAQTQENRLRHELEKWKADCARERHDAGEARTRLTEYRRCVMKMFEQMPDAYLLDLDMAIKSVLASAMRRDLVLTAVGVEVPHDQFHLD